ERKRLEDGVCDVPVVAENEVGDPDVREGLIRLDVEPDEEERQEREDTERQCREAVFQRLIRKARERRSPGNRATVARYRCVCFQLASARPGAYEHCDLLHWRTVEDLRAGSGIVSGSLAC